MPADMKQMIAEALTKLLEHKRVDKITVKELVDACGISRQGFYYHFQDIMEVIEWITAQALQNAVDVSLAAPTPKEALTAVLLAMRENEKLIQHLMASQRRQEVERLLVQAMRAYLEKMVRARMGALAVKPAELDAAIRFYSYGLVGMLVENLGVERDVGETAEQFLRLLTGEVWGGPPAAGSRPLRRLNHSKPAAN